MKPPRQRRLRTLLSSMLCRVRRDEHGQVLPLLASVMVLSAVAGVLVLDVGLLVDTRVRAQTAADLAALAAAQDLPRSMLDPEAAAKLVTAQNTAFDFIERNGFDDDETTVTVQFDGDDDKIEIVVQREQEWLIGRLFGVGPATIGARAVAQTSAQPRDIVLALDRSESMCRDTHPMFFSGPPPGMGFWICPDPPEGPYEGMYDEFPPPLRPNPPPGWIPPTEWQPFDQMRDAAVFFSQQLTPELEGAPFDYLGLVSYADEAEEEVDLSSDYGPGSDYVNAIAGLAPNGFTNIGHAIEESHEMLMEDGHEGTLKVIVLLSDGIPTRHPNPGGGGGAPDFNTCPNGCAAADNYARDEARAAAADGIAIYTIGLKTDLDGDDFLRELAEIGDTQGGGGEFFDVDDPDDLTAVFGEIAERIAIGLVQ